MVPRLGIIVSALIFGALHASYNSTFGIENASQRSYSGSSRDTSTGRAGSLYP